MKAVAAFLILACLVSEAQRAHAGFLPSRVHGSKKHENKHEKDCELFGPRIPRSYFEVEGFGETDEGSGEDPFETGAHDLAMEDAGIHLFNLVTYTSMLPPEAVEISLDEAKETFHHGAVLECILSEVQGSRGDRITAGVGHVMIYNKKTNEASGGFATEYKGHASSDLARGQLKEAIEELFERRFGGEDYEMGEAKYIIESKTVGKGFGTAIAGVCFNDYIFPKKGHAKCR